jgi:Ca-activated chloride channel homolog
VWLRKLMPAAVTVLMLAVLSGNAAAQTVRSHISEGNHVYDKSKYTDAEVEYKKALEKNPKSKEAQFNLGNSYYKQQRFDEAMREYGNSSGSMKLPEERAITLYNTGNALYQSNKYQEAVDAYKQSLRLNPNDEDTRYNLQMARAKLVQQQQQKQQNKDQKQDQKNDQQKQNQQQDQKQDQQQNQKKDQQQQKQEEAKQDQTRQQLQKKNQMPKPEADRILDAMRNNEKDVQKKLRKREAVHMKVEKDW